MDSMKILQAHDYSINICGMCIPKNALYGRVGRFYWYIDDYKQFQDNNALICIYLFDKMTDKKFVPCIAKCDSAIIAKLAKVVKRKDLYNTICVYPLKMGYRSTTDNLGIKMKRSQSEYTYKASNRDNPRTTTDYSCCKRSEWATGKCW